MLPQGAFRPRFFEDDARFWPIAAAAARYADHTEWPAPEELVAPDVRFVTATKPRRARGAVQASARYDARIVTGEVPTRPRSWHDFLNALVWATFPRSKRALHSRQARAIAAQLDAHTSALPNARTREQDALALLDEGGVVVLDAGAASLVVTFGHALYEGLVLGGPPATASALVFAVNELPNREQATAVADELLAERLLAPLAPELLLRRPF